MITNKLTPFFFLLVLVLVSCALGLSSKTFDPTVETQAATLLPAGDVTPILVTATSLRQPTSELPSFETIVLPISVYIVDDEAGKMSSERTAAQLASIYRKVNQIWEPAGIVIEVQTIQRITLPEATVARISAGDFQPFFDGAGRIFDIPDASPLNAFYAREIGGPNGIVPFDSRLFFVNDRPTVHHERVSSHEIGHILGLHHTRADSGRLMFSGTNGMALTEEEIIVARYFAQGMLNRVR